MTSDRGLEPRTLAALPENEQPDRPLAVQQEADRLDQETVVLRSDESADRDDDRNLARVIQPGVRRGFLREPPDARQVDRIGDHRRPVERAADLHPIEQIRAHSFANRVNPGRTRIEQSRQMWHPPHLQLAGLLDPTLVAHDRVLADDQLSRAAGDPPAGENSEARDRRHRNEQIGPLGSQEARDCQRLERRSAGVQPDLDDSILERDPGRPVGVARTEVYDVDAVDTHIPQASGERPRDVRECRIGEAVGQQSDSVRHIATVRAVVRSANYAEQSHLFPGNDWHEGAVS